ncbi:aspartic proteinase-like protein 1 isoform X2 [Ziziphus jujuba]|uniref:Aspartic proteinase-like protein 1 isoform X2 n=2 Tax=Ziziphus jujuba TaxID=326968 RepID=A0ABM3ILE7_ZIZJJ|nr:aspartic proteinase-like protein 1 isoform X2 [Ziziphus jujuba]KAH7524443.1 hypothetical protein FEM48_Zijuj06G0119700 [Ziziphus jujuba var. spinosa]
MANRALALFFIMACLLVNGSVALTFSTKLIHRFSDEAKALLGSSRGGNFSAKLWPKRNSLEYFRLLLRGDVNRQRIKLGSKYDLLFPSEGSETLFFGNDFDWLHYTWIDIGTPNVSFLVALDAGSDLLWVPCDCIQCAPLSASYYNTLDRDMSEYSPSLSSTSKQLPCSHQLCKLSTNCKGPKDPCHYTAEYNTENTSSSGFLIEDKLHLASSSGHAKPTYVQASVILGCGRKQSGGYLEGAAPDGVMGLGPGEISIPSLLAKAGLVQNSFSLCFDDNGSGRLLFGDEGVVTHQYTPFLPIAGKYNIAYSVGVESYCVGSSCLQETGFQALVDSGSSFTYVPSKAYKTIILEFDKQMNATRISPQQYPWTYCYNVSSLELPNIPTMKLIFTSNQSFLIQNPVLSDSANQTEDEYGIIGQNYMMGYRMVFDRENLRLGWSKSNCDDISKGKGLNPAPPSDGSPGTLPASEQQSTANTQAAEPTAMAVTTTSTSSVAVLSYQIPYRFCILTSFLLLMYPFST